MEIIKEIFDIVVSEEKMAVMQCGEMTERWNKAIEKALFEIKNNPSLRYDSENQKLTLRSRSSNKKYEANGTCQCMAFYTKTPCYHRAAARLLQRYYEKLKNNH